MSNGSVEPNEAPLAGLEDGPGEAFARNVELGHSAPIELHATLADEPPSFARRQAESVREKRGEMHRIAGR